MSRVSCTAVLVIAALAVGVSGATVRAADGRGETETMKSNARQTETAALTNLTVKIVHDNCPFDDRLKTAWGFAAMVTGPEKTILFDTGSDGTLLLENMASMEIDPNGIDTVVLSHAHADHTGGLVGFLKANPAVEVFLLESFPTRFKETVRAYGTGIVEAESPREICPNVYSTGRMGREIHEQALVVRTEKGLVVLTGCAHPGVDKIIERVRALHEEDVLLVIGGFHLGWATDGQIEQIIRTLKRLGVRYVAPTHCTGEKAQDLFLKYFGNRCLRAGVGNTITLADLK
jgi:7,8-dihydropterin-6-yl-methyl-4-(beta-D-ribofuranosyl)aminobenzene 5'-phosphate synthase